MWRRRGAGRCGGWKKKRMRQGGSKSLARGEEDRVVHGEHGGEKWMGEEEEGEETRGKKPTTTQAARLPLPKADKCVRIPSAFLRRRLDEDKWSGAPASQTDGPRVDFSQNGSL